jgi:type IV secretion system protein VirB9
MIRVLLPLLVLGAAANAGAQALPRPDAANPRLQTIDWVDGREVILTALPATGLTVVLEPGEQIGNVVTGGEDLLDLQVSAERDSFLIVPKVDLQDLALSVDTDRRSYRFRLRTGTNLMAAYLVRFTYPGDLPTIASDGGLPEPTGDVWSYRLRGDISVRPAAISDDGVRTTIVFGPEQPLPAVLAIGSTGEEEVVNGYMRGDRYVIDRVHPELVFRLDKDKATARRAASPDPRDG